MYFALYNGKSIAQHSDLRACADAAQQACYFEGRDYLAIRYGATEPQERQFLQTTEARKLTKLRHS